MDFLPAVWTGIRVDAKWLGLALIPAWLALILSCWVRPFYIISCILAGIGYFLMILLDAGNFGFYGFYKTPISPLVYGLLQDDTKAIIETIWEDWPVVSYLIVILVSVAIPFLCCRMVKSPKTFSPMDRGSAFVLGLCITFVLVIIVRGSLSKFPLRQEDFSVSKISLINSCVPNGFMKLRKLGKIHRSQAIPIRLCTSLVISQRRKLRRTYRTHQKNELHLPISLM